MLTWLDPLVRSLSDRPIPTPHEHPTAGLPTVSVSYNLLCGRVLPSLLGDQVIDRTSSESVCLSILLIQGVPVFLILLLPPPDRVHRWYSFRGSCHLMSKF